MISQERTSLKELQSLDTQLGIIRSTIDNFEMKLEKLQAPTLRLGKEVTALEKRVKELSLEEKRLELGIREKRDRSDKLQERMNQVRNVREEAAVHAESEMVKRTLQNDEQEALTVMNQIKKMTERINEQKDTHGQSLAEMEPLREQLMSERGVAELNLEKLDGEREGLAKGLNVNERKVYDRIMSGQAKIAVSDLTEDGACGYCYSMVPLQMQNEIRHSESLIRCEECGVILTPQPSDTKIDIGSEGNTDEFDGSSMSDMGSQEAESLEISDT